MRNFVVLVLFGAGLLAAAFGWHEFNQVDASSRSMGVLALIAAVGCLVAAVVVFSISILIRAALALVVAAVLYGVASKMSLT